MSEFDKEAEREKLREKYGDEADDRAATERMSDLLLKGATMTNRHCSDCGDPVFRYDGQAFCPTCEKPVGSADEATEEAASTTTDPDGSSDAGEPGVETDAAAQPGAEETRDLPAEGPGTGGSEAPARQEPTADPAAGEPTPDADAAPTGGDERAASTPSPSGRPTTSGRPERDDAGDLGAAEASLARQVADLAARAEGADDLRHQRDLLAGAREAAEALAAVRRA